METKFKSLKTYEVTYLKMEWIRTALSRQGIFLSKSQVMNLAINQLSKSLQKIKTTQNDNN